MQSILLVGADPRVCPDLGGHIGPPLRKTGPRHLYEEPIRFTGRMMIFALDTRGRSSGKDLNMGSFLSEGGLSQSSSVLSGTLIPFGGSIMEKGDIPLSLAGIGP